MAERVNAGTSNDSIIDVIKKHLGSAFKGPGWDALIAALAEGDKIVADNNRYAFDQLFKSTASGKYLSDRASDVGINQPNNVGMSDELFRDFIIKKTASKLTATSIMEILEIFYSPDAVRANVTSGAEGSVTFEQGDELRLAIDNIETHTVFFNVGTFTMAQIAVVVNRVFQLAGSKAYALSVVDPTTGTNKLRLYSGSLGLSGVVQITGGKAQNVLRFPTSVPMFSGFAATKWDISVPTPGLAKFTSVPRANLCPYSQELDHSSWGKSGVNITPNAILAPDGTLTADKVYDTTAADTIHGVVQTIPCTIGAKYTQSVYVKAAEYNKYVVLIITGSSYTDNPFLSIDFTTGTGTVNGPVGTTYGREVLANGWYRVWMTAPAQATGTGLFYIELTKNDGNRIYTGDGVSGSYLWGVQVERSDAPTAYIPTTATFAADATTVPSGMIDALPGDYVNVYGTTFGSNRGNFEITDVLVDYPGPTVNFTVKNPDAVAQNGIVQSAEADVQTFRPTKFTLNSLQRAAYVSQSDDSGFRLTLPVTTQVVGRAENTGAYVQANDEIEIATVSRNASGVLTVVASDPHGLAVGDQIIIDGVTANAGAGIARFNDTYSVATVVDPTTFTVNSSVLSAKTGTGGNITTFKAAAATTPGPYILDPEDGFAVTGTEASLATDYTRFVSYSQLKVGSTAGFPDTTGWLVLGFGTKYETGPIPYYGVLDGTRLKIGSSFVFDKTVPAGNKVTLLAGKSPWAPVHPETAGLFYATDSASGLVAAIETVDSISAADSQISKNIIYPGDRGLGGESKPVSDIVRIYG
jgi:hypothetical protein